MKLSNFYVRSSVFVALSLVGAALNYLLYPIVAHILPTSQFGDFTTLSAFANQVLGIFLAFNVVSIYLVKTNPEKVAREKSQVILKVLVWLLVFITITIVVFSPILKTQLKIFNTGGFLMMAAIIIVSIPAVIWNGYLQGHKETEKVGLFAFSSAAFKLIFSVLLVSTLGVTGGLGGIAIGLVCGLVVLYLSTRRKLPKLRIIFSKLSQHEKSFIKSISKYVFGAVIVVGGLGFLQNIDILYAKAIFSPRIAGIYSGISILSNSVYYVCFLLIWILLPEIDTNNIKHNNRILKSAYKYLAIIALVVTAAEFLIGKNIIKLFLGEKFMIFSNLLIIATLFQILLVAITIYAYYMLVLRRIESVYLAICTILPSVILPLYYSKTPEQLITSLLFGLLIGFIIFVFIKLILNNRASYVKQEN